MQQQESEALLQGALDTAHLHGKLCVQCLRVEFFALVELEQDLVQPVGKLVVVSGIERHRGSASRRPAKDRLVIFCFKCFMICPSLDRSCRFRKINLMNSENLSASSTHFLRVPGEPSRKHGLGLPTLSVQGATGKLLSSPQRCLTAARR